MNFNFEYLKHGKALCGKVFKRFVETFNFHNDFISNLKGDADLPTEGGHVNVDTTDPSHPVIRCKGCGGGSSAGGTSTTAPSPFEFTMVTPEPEEGEEEEPTGTPAIVNNTFYWDGVLKSLSNFTPPATCTVYLCCTQAAPSASGEVEWEFEIATSEAQAPSGGRVVNYKLYDIAANKVTMDYRTTFLELNSPHKVSKFTVERYDGEDGKVELDATNEGNPLVRVAGDANNYARMYASNNASAVKGLHVNSDSSQAKLLASSTAAYLSLNGTQSSYVSIKASQKSVLIDPSGIEHGNEVKFHKLTVKHADPDTPDDEYDVLADKDITIHEGAAEERLTGVELDLYGETNLRLKLTFTDKDGKTRDEYSTGITLKKVDVVSDVSWISPTLRKSATNLTVISAAAGGDTNLFTAVAHSTNHNS